MTHLQQSLLTELAYWEHENRSAHDLFEKMKRGEVDINGQPLHLCPFRARLNGQAKTWVSALHL